ncbi:uncharacterized protein LOC133196238 [Saccostrea echinata]|uniref:uncharacterized protein LOC133196238 n=1 Tax=Saccostrea echinata TaxID=191078 RepID=UPI002A7FAD9D|nr:uncharacterized protein LOC133196238 [Saccostrea echinata]
MNAIVFFILVFATLVNSAIFSLLTDGELNSTEIDASKMETQNVDVFRQLLNQETIIRMTLVKNVHALMKDMLTLKEDLAEAESKISAMHASFGNEISELKKDLELLKLENNILKNESSESKKYLKTVGENITKISKNQEKYKRTAEAKLQMYERNISDVLADIKIEVRYLSITLLDLKAHTETAENNISVSIAEKIGAIYKSMNNSLDSFNEKLMATESKFSVAVSELKKSQVDVKAKFSDEMNTTINSLKDERKQSQLEQLKLSSTVKSLEMFRMNMTNKNCDLSKKVGFTAVVTSSNTGWNSGTLVFPAVITNIGVGYNSSTGVFTAPFDGNYVFFLTVLEYSNQYSAVDIVLNGISKVRSIGDSNAKYQTGVNLVVLRLQRGDRVWARYFNGRGYYSATIPTTTFSGFIL